MEISEGSPIAGIGESEIDFTMVQLLETSDEFRRWMTEHAIGSEMGEYLGAVAHAVYAGEGESDIEYGFVTREGERHIVLIENEINASLQPDQYQRYYNRGQFRVERQEWDAYTVCLLAPEGYISDSDEAGVDSVILYEEVLDQLSELEHDSATFFIPLFEDALRKPNRTVDSSGTIDTILTTFNEYSGIESLRGQTASKTQLTLESTHRDHPTDVVYNINIATPDEDGRTNVRLQINKDTTESERESLKQTLSMYTDLLPDHDWNFDYKVHIGLKKLWHRDAVQNPSARGYEDEIMLELKHLTETIHPRLVDDRDG